MEGRVPPYSAEAERAVLGAILLNNAVLAQAMMSVSPEHFYVEAYRRLYTGMIEVADTGQAIDAVTLGNHIKEAGDLEKVGGAAVFASLTNDVAVTTEVGNYAKIVREKAVVRKIIYSAMEISAKGFGGVDSVTEYADMANKSILEASRMLQVGKGPVHIDETLIDVFRDLESGEEPKGIVKTGIDTIDSVTGGLHPSLLTVIAGRPAMGKSSLALNIATNAALSGKKVLYITLEDARKYVVMRMLARFADIDLTDLTLRRVSQDEWPRLVEAVTKLSGKKPLWVEDTSGLTSTAIRQIVITHKMFHGLDLLMVDHLGEVYDDGDSDTAIITSATKTFRDIAKDLALPTVLLCQLNRKVEERKGNRPVLSDLKQSGKIEEAARNVWFIFRPGYYEPDGDEWRELELIVAKANHGKTGTLRLFSDLSRMYIRGWSPETDGLFNGDHSGEAQSARSGAQGRKKEETGAQRAFFYDGGGAYDQSQED
jgi:replicative DNA helicase